MTDPLLSSDETLRRSREASFVISFTALCLQHKITVGGCGCCGSPFLVDLQNRSEEATQVVLEGTLTSLRDTL